MLPFRPRKDSEANLQAEFYHQAKTAGIQPFLEYKVRGSKNGGRGCRFDAVIHDTQEIFAIIEIKNPSRPMKYDWTKTKQYARYHSYGVPVFLIKSQDDINPTIVKLGEIKRGDCGSQEVAV